MTFRKVADIGVLVGIGIFVGLMIADASTAEHYLSEWQTLVAGILAVIAAAWTVGEMRKSEARQQHRHDEQMAIGKRSEAMVRARAKRATVIFADLEAQLITINRRFSERQWQENEVPTPSEVAELCGVVDAFNRRMEEPLIIAALPYLDPETAFSFQVLSNRVQGFKERYERMMSAIARGDGVHVKVWKRQFANYAVVEFQRCLPVLEIFSKGLANIEE